MAWTWRKVIGTSSENCRQILKEKGNPIEAIREMRHRFGITVAEAKELWLQVTGQADSLYEHQAALAVAVEAVFTEQKQ